MSSRVDKETGEVLDENSTVELFGPDGKSIGGPMTGKEFKERAQRADAFALEPSEPGRVPQRVIDELCNAYRIAANYAAAFNDANKAQAEKHQIEPKALRKYIAALESDKTDEARKEADDLLGLLGSM